MKTKKYIYICRFLETPGHIGDVSYLQNAVRAGFKREQDQKEIRELPTVLKAREPFWKIQEVMDYEKMLPI